jgi:hypothetical protein
MIIAPVEAAAPNPSARRFLNWLSAITPADRSMPGSAVATRTWLIVASCVGASLVSYALLLSVVKELGPAEPSYAGEVFPWVELLTRGSMVKHHVAASIRFLLLLLGLFAAYGLALRVVADRRSSRLQMTVFAAGAVFLVVQALQPAMLSTDVYSYVMYGRIFGLYHGDPYVKLPYRSIDDPFLPLAYDLPWPSWYGPLWTLISAGLALLGGERIGLTVLLFRAVAVAAALAAGALIWDCLRRAAPDRAAQGLVLFLWNPLLVLETGMSAHNDAVMAALLLLGIWLLLRGRRVVAVVALTLSVLVKFLTGLILPLCVLLVLRRARTWPERGRYLALSSTAAALTATVVFGLARAGPGLPVFQAAGESFFYENNVQELLFRQVRLWLGEDPEAVGVPVHFHPSWVVGRAAIPLFSAARPSTEVLERLEPATALFVVSPAEGERLRVYNPLSGHRGYVEKFMVTAERPTVSRVDLDRVEREQDPVASPLAARVNIGLRLVSWAAFGAFLLLVTRRATDDRRFLVGAAAALLASYWLVTTEAWPWYVIWALALTALVPTSRPAGLVVVLSATILSLYATLGFEHIPPAWIYAYRSLPAFLLPLVLFGLYQTLSGRWRAFRRAVAGGGLTGPLDQRAA